MTDTISTEDQITTSYNTFVAEVAKFRNGNKSAGTRARAALLAMTKLAKVCRTEIQNVKNAGTTEA